ncbi:MAG: hypothetical protein ABEI52_05250, partial [Halobacteriaceae archaeon]
LRRGIVDRTAYLRDLQNSFEEMRRKQSAKLADVRADLVDLDVDQERQFDDLDERLDTDFRKLRRRT